MENTIFKNEFDYDKLKGNKVGGIVALITVGLAICGELIKYGIDAISGIDSTT